MPHPRKNLPPPASLLSFEAAARLESFTKAAAELRLTQAALARLRETYVKGYALPPLSGRAGQSGLREGPAA